MFKRLLDSLKLFEGNLNQMRKGVLLMFFVACCVQLAQAQDAERGVEVFGGYSFLAAQSRLTNNDVRTFGGLTPAQIRALTGFELIDNQDRFIPAQGFEVSATKYVSKRVGLTADFSGTYHRERQVIGNALFRTNHSVYNFLGGPHVRFTNKSRITPFVHALFGAARVRTKYQEINDADPGNATDSSTRFAMSFGGGFDVRVSERVALRVFQLDYNPVLGKDRRVVANDGTVIDLQGRAQNKNFRVSVGVVFK